MSFCAHCKAGHILPGEPNGSFHDGAYYAVGADQTKAVILLTDAFGLPMKNCKIMADQFAEQIGCDVWVPDICNGELVKRLASQHSNDWNREPTFQRGRFSQLSP